MERRLCSSSSRSAPSHRVITRYLPRLKATASHQHLCSTAPTGLSARSYDAPPEQLLICIDGCTCVSHKFNTDCYCVYCLRSPRHLLRILQVQSGEIEWVLMEKMLLHAGCRAYDNVKAAGNVAGLSGAAPGSCVLEVSNITNICARIWLRHLCACLRHSSIHRPAL